MKTIYTLSIAIVISLVLFSQSAFASNRYWVSNGSNTDWNNTQNWSNVSGGTNGYAVPGSNDVVHFDANGNFNCILSGNISIQSLQTEVGYTGTINPGVYNIYVQGGSIDWRAGTLATGTGVFTFDTPGEFIIYGGTFNCPSGGMTVNKIFKLEAGIFNAYSYTQSFTNNFHIDGGTFNATTATMQLSGSSLNFDVPASFIHNNGKVIFGGGVTSNIQIGMGPNRRLTLYQCELNKTGSGTTQDNLNIRDDDTIRVMSTFTATDGQIKGLNSAVEINASFTSAATFTSSNTSIVFIGSADQTINMASGSRGNLDGDFCMNKPNNSKVILESPIELNQEGQELMLFMGRIKTTTTNILTLGNNVTVNGGSNNSHVDGPMQKAGKDGFTFPVGKAGYYAPIAISGNNNMGTMIATTTTFRAEYFKQDPHSLNYNVNAKEVTIGSISRCEFWNLERISGTANAYVWLSFESTRTCYANPSLSHKMVCHWNGSSWEDKGNGATNANFIRSGSLASSFSPWSIGSVDASDITLPLLFSNFSAVVNGTSVKMNWNLYNDVINTGDHMYIQRSTDGKNWMPIAEVRFEASKYDYQGTDFAPVAGINYYRVKIAENTGNVIYSPTRFIRTDKAANVVTLSPNPAVNDFRVMLATPYGSGEMQIFNMSGKKVYAENISGKQVITVNTATYAPGVPLLIAGDNEKIQQKFVVQK